MKLYYDHPAENWHESLPLGNGRIGAMVYGGTKKEILALNEDTLWSGYPEKTQKKLPEGYLEKVRELTEKREYQKAMEYLEECFSSSEDVQMYVPFGNVYMEMLDGTEEISDYHRELCLDTAEVRITYKNQRLCQGKLLHGWDSEDKRAVSGQSSIYRRRRWLGKSCSRIPGRAGKAGNVLRRLGKDRHRRKSKRSSQCSYCGKCRGSNALLWDPFQLCRL